MLFQKRDGEIIEAIQEYGGLLGMRHIKSMFWLEKSLRAMQQRLTTLVNNHYLARPTRRQWHTRPVPESIYWLGPQGALWLAGQWGIVLSKKYAKEPNENYQRKLEKELRKGGLRWLREPRWNQILHDLAIVECRLAVERAIQEFPNLSLGEWRHETMFLSDPDAIEIDMPDRKGNRQMIKKRIIPDSYFEIENQNLASGRRPAKARYLLELDGATHSNPKFGVHKVLPGIAYLKSPEYKARFGANAGRWLVITSGKKRRMENLIQQTQTTAGTQAYLFLFTTFSKIRKYNFIADNIWNQAEQDHPISLLSLLR